MGATCKKEIGLGSRTEPFNRFSMRLALLAWVASAQSDCSSLLQAKLREKQEEAGASHHGPWSFGHVRRGSCWFCDPQSIEPMFPHRIMPPISDKVQFCLSAASEWQPCCLHCQAGAWRTPRDLAVNQDVKLFFAGGQELIVFSAVPSFDSHRSEIAVLVDNLPGVEGLLKRKPVFCSERGQHPNQVTLAGLRGPSESHMALNSSLLLQKGSKYLVLRCPWPADEANREVFEVTVEQGPHQLGTVLARHNPSLLKNYGTVACVRELFVQAKELSNSPLRLLPQWLEWHRMKGVEHFLFYTFNQTISAEFKAIMEPFIKKGLASRVHFDNYPPFHRNRHWRVIADCLPRFRGHAKWLLPAIDLDEYLVLSPELFQSDSLPEDYMSSAWDTIARFYGKRPEEVNSISFDGFRFEPPGAAVLDITSTLREGILQKTPYQHGLHEGPGWRKHVVNVENTETLDWLRVKSFISLRVMEASKMANGGPPLYTGQLRRRTGRLRLTSVLRWAT